MTVKIPSRAAERLIAYCKRKGIENADEFAASLIDSYLEEHGFKIGDLVNYHTVIGGPATLHNTVILDGPFDQCGTTTWKIKHQSGTVAEAALTLVNP